MQQSHETFIQFKEIIIKNSIEMILAFNNSNTLSNKENILLEMYFDKAIEILIYWRRLVDDSEFLLGKYNSGIVAFIFNSFNNYNNELIKSENSNIGNKSYEMSSVAKLKETYSQRVF